MLTRITFLLMVCVSIACSNESNPPAWMYNLSASDDMKLGYGEGTTMQAAEANARSEIAHSIKVTLTEKYSKTEQLKNDDYSKDIERKIEEEVDIELTGLRTLKSENKDGTYYVALEFDGRSLQKKIKSCISPDKKLKMMSSSNPYSHTFFSKELHKIFPELSTVPEYDVVYTNGLYKLLLDDKEFNIGQDAIEKFLFDYGDSSFNISLVPHMDDGSQSSSQLKEGTYFHLDIKLSEPGYLSLLSIDEEGKVCMMFDNEKVSEKQTITFPDLELYDGLRTEIISRHISALESYVAVLCKEKQRYTHFEDLGETVNTNKRSQRFPRLYNDIQSCKYTSVVLETNR